MHDQPHSIHFLMSTAPAPAPAPATFYVQVPQVYFSIIYALTCLKSRGTKAFTDGFFLCILSCTGHALFLWEESFFPLVSVLGASSQARVYNPDSR